MPLRSEKNKPKQTVNAQTTISDVNSYRSCKVVLQQANFFNNKKLFSPCSVILNQKSIPFTDSSNKMKLTTIPVKTRSGRIATKISHNFSTKNNSTSLVKLSDDVSLNSVNEVRKQKKVQDCSQEGESIKSTITKRNTKSKLKGSANFNTDIESNKNTRVEINKKTKGTAKKKEIDKNINERKKTDSLNKNNESQQRSSKRTKKSIEANKDNKNTPAEINKKTKDAKEKEIDENINERKKTNKTNESRQSSSKRTNKSIEANKDNSSRKRGNANKIQKNVVAINKKLDQNDVNKIDKLRTTKETNEAKKQMVVKVVRIEENKMETKGLNKTKEPIVKKLRKPKSHNYAEISLQTSQTLAEPSFKQGPVYRKKLPSPNDHKVNDIFEFDDKDERKEMKKRRDSDCFDADIMEDLEKIKKHEIKLAKELSKKRKPKPVKKTILKKNNKHNDNSVVNIKLNKPQQNVKNNIHLAKEANELKTPINNLAVDNSFHEADQNYSVDNLFGFNEIPINFNSLKTPLNAAVSPAKMTPKPVKNYSEAEHSIKISPIIHTISSASDKSEASKISNKTPERTGEIIFNESYHNFKRQVANSTMLPNRSPWRTNIVLHRGPLFLTTKKSSLPAYNQEMVINSRFLDSLDITKDAETPKHIGEEIVNVSSPRAINKSPLPTKKSTQKSTKQKSILNYFNNNVKNIENIENEINCSLFDENLLSPIKQSTNKQSPISIKAKRHIFKELHCNAISTPNKAPPTLTPEDSNDEAPKADKYFGFDSSIQDEPLDVIAKPTRLTLVPIKKVVTHDVRNETLKEMIDETFPSPVSQTEEIKVGIFDDLEETRPLPIIQYKSKRTKRKGPISTYEEEEISEEEEYPEKKKRKQKNTRSKKEELEAEKWAKAFNAMCDEIEQHTFEVE